MIISTINDNIVFSFPVFFSLIRPFLGYFILMYPNGQPWFTRFICYSALYIDLNRSTSLLQQTWEAFDDITPFRGTLEESPLRPPDAEAKDYFELRFDWMFAKLNNKLVTVPQKYLGRLDKEHLVESPNNVLWLDMLLREQFGIGLLKLRSEKRANTALWKRIKCSYMFPGSRESRTYTGELANQHLRQIMTFLGFAPRIVGMSNCHSSYRGGGSAGSEFNVRAGRLQYQLFTCLLVLQSNLFFLLLLRPRHRKRRERGRKVGSEEHCQPDRLRQFLSRTQGYQHERRH